MKVMIVVTHLLGTGHLRRAMILAQAFVQAGHQPVVVSGGVPPNHLNTEGVELIQLPPVKSNGVDFTQLLDGNGMVATEQQMAKRLRILVGTFEQHTPAALITELFPFGRRILKAEFLGLLTAAWKLRNGPRVFASIRDILAPPTKQAKADFAAETIAAFYDAVLVHADPDMTPLELSWPVTKTLSAKLRYTGFVAPAAPPEHPERLGAGEILVSAGGGDVGMALYSCAKDAARNDPQRQWRLLVGGQNAAEKCAVLKEGASENLLAEPARPDFRQMLHHAAASVSFCGYNTALDVLQTGCPAVFVPFDEGNEVEQGLRANALAHHPKVEVLRSAEMTPENLLSAIAAATAPGQADRADVACDGAARSVEIVSDLCGERS